MTCLLCLARAQQAQTPQAPPQRKPSQVGLVRNLVGVTVLGLIVWYSGSVHCVKTPSGYKVVDKEDWGFYDQFVNVDEFTDKPLIALLPRARTVRALIRAGILRRPDDDPEPTPTAGYERYGMLPQSGDSPYSVAAAFEDDAGAVGIRATTTVDGTTLVFDAAGCNADMLARLAGLNGARDALRRAKLNGIACARGGARMAFGG